MICFARLTLIGLVLFSLGGCGQGADESSAHRADFMSGRQEGCVEAGGVWDADTSSCAKAAQWLMTQDADGVSFAFDDAMGADCSSDAFWSGTMTLTGADSDTLWFSDRPHRLAFTSTTAAFVSVFADAFGKAGGGNPNAVLAWDDATTGDEMSAVVELVAIAGSSPSYDADSDALIYQVCGLELEDPKTLAPLPASEQLAPESSPRAAGRYSLFIDQSAGWMHFASFLNNTQTFFTKGKITTAGD